MQWELCLAAAERDGFAAAECRLLAAVNTIRNLAAMEMGGKVGIIVSGCSGNGLSRLFCCSGYYKRFSCNGNGWTEMDEQPAAVDMQLICCS